MSIKNGYAEVFQMKTQNMKRKEKCKIYFLLFLWFICKTITFLVSRKVVDNITW